MANAPAPAGLAFQDASGDSLTNFIRSIEGLTGAQGQQTLNSGQSVFRTGVNASAPALDFLTKLTKGDQGDVTEAAQPEIDQIQQSFAAARNMISQQPRGGGKTTALAEAPFKEAGDVQRVEGQMRTNAAGQLGGLANQIAGLGLGESNLGEGLESLSSNIALTKEGQNYSQPSALEQVIGSISSLASAIL